MAGDTKQRMVEAAAELLRTRGLSATSFTDVLSSSGAARGAIYHHFPEGKAELARNAVAWTGRSVQANLARLEGVDGPAIVSAFLAAVRPVVAQSAAGAGCAVAAVTVECAPGDETLLDATRSAFDSWVNELADLFAARGIGDDAASSMAALMITFLEGAHLLCRAAGSLEPFDRGAVALSAASRALFVPGT